MGSMAATMLGTQQLACSPSDGNMLVQCEMNLGRQNNKNWVSKAETTLDNQ